MPALTSFLSALLSALWPARMRVGARERLRVVAGALLGILLTSLLCHMALTGAGPWIVAPLGASAVLVFGLPASPLAQPWSVIGGNSLSALVGAACGLLIHDPVWAGAIAVSLAIAVMFATRCLHPPGGAAALLSAMGGVSLSFALFPVAVNSLLLVAVGMAYNSLTGRRYPHRQLAPVASTTPTTTARFSSAYLDAALAHYNQVVDISRDDLEELLQHAEAAAYQRSFGELLCAHIMSREPMAVEYGTPLQEAWQLLQGHHIKALPVIDRVRRVIGILTQADFMRHAGLQTPAGLTGRLQQLVRPSGLSHSAKPEVVGQIMSASVLSAATTQRVSELVPLFAKAGHHHLPVVDEERRLVGIITQSDLVKALHGAVKA